MANAVMPLAALFGSTCLVTASLLTLGSPGTMSPNSANTAMSILHNATVVNAAEPAALPIAVIREVPVSFFDVQDFFKPADKQHEMPPLLQDFLWLASVASSMDGVDVNINHFQEEVQRLSDYVRLVNQAIDELNVVNNLGMYADPVIAMLAKELNQDVTTLAGLKTELNGMTTEQRMPYAWYARIEELHFNIQKNMARGDDGNALIDAVKEAAVAIRPPGGDKANRLQDEFDRFIKTYPDFMQAENQSDGIDNPTTKKLEPEALNISAWVGWKLIARDDLGDMKLENLPKLVKAHRNIIDQVSQAIDLEIAKKVRDNANRPGWLAEMQNVDDNKLIEKFSELTEFTQSMPEYWAPHGAIDETAVKNALDRVSQLLNVATKDFARSTLGIFTRDDVGEWKFDLSPAAQVVQGNGAFGEIAAKLNKFADNSRQSAGALNQLSAAYGKVAGKIADKVADAKAVETWANVKPQLDQVSELAQQGIPLPLARQLLEGQGLSLGNSAARIINVREHTDLDVYCAFDVEVLPTNNAAQLRVYLNGWTISKNGSLQLPKMDSTGFQGVSIGIGEEVFVGYRELANIDGRNLKSLLRDDDKFASFLEVCDRLGLSLTLNLGLNDPKNKSDVTAWVQSIADGKYPQLRLEYGPNLYAEIQRNGTSLPSPDQCVDALTILINQKLQTAAKTYGLPRIGSCDFSGKISVVEKEKQLPGVLFEARLSEIGGPGIKQFEDNAIVKGLSNVAAPSAPNVKLNYAYINLMNDNADVGVDFDFGDVKGHRLSFRNPDATSIVNAVAESASKVAKQKIEHETAKLEQTIKNAVKDVVDIDAAVNQLKTQTDSLKSQLHLFSLRFEKVTDEAAVLLTAEPFSAANDDTGCGKKLNFKWGIQNPNLAWPPQAPSLQEGADNDAALRCWVLSVLKKSNVDFAIPKPESFNVSVQAGDEKLIVAMTATLNELWSGIGLPDEMGSQKLNLNLSISIADLLQGKMNSSDVRGGIAGVPIELNLEFLKVTFGAVGGPAKMLAEYQNGCIIVPVSVTSPLAAGEQLSGQLVLGKGAPHLIGADQMKERLLTWCNTRVDSYFQAVLKGIVPDFLQTLVLDKVKPKATLDWDIGKTFVRSVKLECQTGQITVAVPSFFGINGLTLTLDISKNDRNEFAARLTKFGAEGDANLFGVVQLKGVNGTIVADKLTSLEIDELAIGDWLKMNECKVSFVGDSGMTIGGNVVMLANTKQSGGVTISVDHVQQHFLVQMKLKLLGPTPTDFAIELKAKATDGNNFFRIAGSGDIAGSPMSLEIRTGIPVSKGAGIKYAGPIGVIDFAGEVYVYENDLDYVRGAGGLKRSFPLVGEVRAELEVRTVDNDGNEDRGNNQKPAKVRGLMTPLLISINTSLGSMDGLKVTAPTMPIDIAKYIASLIRPPKFSFKFPGSRSKKSGGGGDGGEGKAGIKLPDGALPTPDGTDEFKGYLAGVQRVDENTRVTLFRQKQDKTFEQHILGNLTGYCPETAPPQFAVADVQLDENKNPNLVRLVLNDRSGHYGIPLESFTFKPGEQSNDPLSAMKWLPDLADYATCEQWVPPVIETVKFPRWSDGVRNENSDTWRLTWFDPDGTPTHYTVSLNPDADASKTWQRQANLAQVGELRVFDTTYDPTKKDSGPLLVEYTPASLKPHLNSNGCGWILEASPQGGSVSTAIKSNPMNNTRKRAEFIVIDRYLEFSGDTVEYAQNGGGNISVGKADFKNFVDISTGLVK